MRNPDEIILTNDAAINVIRNIAGMDPDYNIQRDRFMEEAARITIIEDESGFTARIPDLNLDFLDDDVIMDQVGIAAPENYCSDASVQIRVVSTSCVEYASVYISEDNKKVTVKDEKYNDLKYILSDAA